MTSIPPSLLD